MRKLVFGMLAVAMVATPAMAELSAAPHTGPMYTASKAGMNDPQVRASTAVYDSLGRPGTFPFLANAPAVGVLGYDDYDTISGVNFTQANFVGGVTRASGVLGSAAVMWFEFFTPAFAFATSYGVLLPVPGNYIWTITGLSGAFPHTGFHQIVANSTYTGGGAFSTTIAGQWFLTTTAAVVVGSNNPLVGGGSTTGGASLVNAFAFAVPEPTTIGLLGAGMLLILRRRR